VGQARSLRRPRRPPFCFQSPLKEEFDAVGSARPSRDPLIAAHQQLTREWWESRRPMFDLYVSEAVLEESSAGDATFARKRLELLADIPTLALTGGILKLAEALVTEGPIPRKAAGDALHIAVATVYGCEYLLTWNCRHIANAEIQRAARLGGEEAGI
jgi:hypothetical protein